MVDNDRNASSAHRARQRAIRVRMAETGESYIVAARRHDEREELRREGQKAPMARCPRCQQGAVLLDEQPSCPECGAVWESGAELAGDYAAEILGLDSYTSIKDGGEEPTLGCSVCGQEAVVSIEPGDTTFWTMMSMSCEAVFNDRCTRCGAPIQHREEGDLLICTTCWDDVVSR
jgi:hypothetical protein